MAFYKGFFQKSNKRKQLGLEILLALHVVLIFQKASPFWLSRRLVLELKAFSFFHAQGVRVKGLWFRFAKPSIELQKHS